MIIGGSILPFSVADKTIVRCFFSLPVTQTTHSLTPFEEIDFTGTVWKKLPCKYTYSATDEGLYGQLVELVSDFMQSYRIRIQLTRCKKHKEKEEKH